MDFANRNRLASNGGNNVRPGGCTGRGWVKGQSGNPKGRPKRADGFSKVIRAWLNAKDPAAKNAAHTRLQSLIERLYREDPKTLLAYAYGKPAQMVEMSGGDTPPFEFVIKVRPEELP